MSTYLYDIRSLHLSLPPLAPLLKFLKTLWCYDGSLWHSDTGHQSLSRHCFTPSSLARAHLSHEECLQNVMIINIGHDHLPFILGNCLPSWHNLSLYHLTLTQTLTETSSYFQLTPRSLLQIHISYPKRLDTATKYCVDIQRETRESYLISSSEISRSSIQSYGWKLSLFWWFWYNTGNKQAG